METTTRRKVGVGTVLLALALAFALAQVAFPQAASASTADPLKGAVLKMQDDDADTSASDLSYGYGVGADIERAQITLESASLVYTGAELEPQATVTLDGKTLRGSSDFQDSTADYWYFYLNNISVNSASAPQEDQPQIVIATFSPEEPYVYVREAHFDIKPANIKGTTLKATNEVYTGKKLKPDTIVTYNGLMLKRGTDYTVSCKNNKKVGKGTATVKGKGNFTGSETTTFKIRKASIKSATFTDVKDRMYTGKSIKPKVKVRYAGKVLKANRDYTVKYAKNVKAGIGTITIKGKGSLKGTQKIQFGILPRPIDDEKTVKVSIDDSNALWNGSFVYPSLTVKYNGKALEPDTDFNVTYSNNTEVSELTRQKTAKLVIYGCGNFTGSYEAGFYVHARPINNVAMQIAWYKDSTYAAGGYPIVLFNGRELVKDIDYKIVDIAEKTDTGTVYKYTITGLGHFTGSYTYTKP